MSLKYLCSRITQILSKTAVTDQNIEHVLEAMADVCLNHHGQQAEITLKWDGNSFTSVVTIARDIRNMKKNP